METTSTDFSQLPARQAFISTESVWDSNEGAQLIVGIVSNDDTCVDISVINEVDYQGATVALTNDEARELRDRLTEILEGRS